MGVVLNAQLDGQVRASRGLVAALQAQVIGAIGASFEHEIDLAATLEASDVRAAQARLIKKYPVRPQDPTSCNELTEAARRDTTLTQVLFANPKELIDAWIKDACHG